MECVRLLESVDKIGHTGICIAAENCQILKNSLLILQKENHFRKTFYWGRINGIQADYHVAYGYEKDCLKDRVFFYSLDGLEWLLMSKSNKCSRFLTPLATSPFEGNPSIVTNVLDANPAFPPGEDPPDIFEGAIPNELKEEDRLAAIVDIITEESMVIPRGSFFKHPNGQITENSGFAGLNLMESKELSNYVHARHPRENWEKNLLTRDDYNYALDFLDPIHNDAPKECWNLQTNSAGRLVILQNLFWPGMIFYHIVDSPHFGSLYIGTGKKNWDVPFMV